MEQLELEFMEWKPVEGFEGLYDLRSDGLLYSYPRKYCKGGYSYGNETKGYLYKTLYKDNKGITKQMHQWVCITFVGPIPEGYDIHHINHNRTDNRVENLELIEHKKHTILHSKDRKRTHNNVISIKCLEAAKAANEKRCKPVLQYTIDGDFVAEYKSSREAERKTNILHSSINDVCLNKPHHKTAGGYIWKYAS